MLFNKKCYWLIFCGKVETFGMSCDLIILSKHFDLEKMFLKIPNVFNHKSTLRIVGCELEFQKHIYKIKTYLIK